jgi:hypothetical protein
VTKPEKQDGTMELDVGQIDLLDLPLPPASNPSHSVSKGPPPLPPSLPPLDAAAPPPDDMAVPSLVLPEPSSPSTSDFASSMSHAPTPPPAISARTLVNGPANQKSPVMRFMLGMGAATVVCVIGWFALQHALHKSAPAAASASPAPVRSFTMAPIEFTAGSSSASVEEEAPSAHASASASAPPSASASSRGAATTTATAATTTSRATAAPATTNKPPRTDELIKVEN